MKYFLVFAILAAFLAFVCAGTLNLGDDVDLHKTGPWIRLRRGSCDFYGCQRHCHNTEGSGPKGGGVCIKNHCDCSVVPKDK